MIQRLAQLRRPSEFAGHIHKLGILLDFDPELSPGPASPLRQPYTLQTKNGTWILSNRWCALPMEGWDAEPDGCPGELVKRRWQRFGRSGAKLIWGGEAAAVCPAGRANPRQLLINEATLPDLARLRQALVQAHRERWGAEDLFIGLQLTHSGRFCHPHEQNRSEPHILYRHPLLDRKFGLPEHHPLMSDGEIEDLIADYVKAALLSQQAGFQFVDIKHCHGYLGHEFLSAQERPGRYGGSFENRTRFLREIVQGIHSQAPGLEIGVRVSAFDFIPFKLGPDGTGMPEPYPGKYPYAFGGDGSGTGLDLSEPHRFLDLLESLEIRLVNLTAGSPYYNPHIQRPALFPPSDGYLPPEDPLVGVARLIGATAELKAQHPQLLIVGSGYSYLQEWLPHVAQNVIRTARADFIGLGRTMLAYPELCADLLEGKPISRKRLCRSFSDCTNAPRLGMVSGCYPFDEFYQQRPETMSLKEWKRTRKTQESRK